MIKIIECKNKFYLKINGWESEEYQAVEALKITYKKYIKLMLKCGAIEEALDYFEGRDDYYFPTRESIEKFVEIIEPMMIMNKLVES